MRHAHNDYYAISEKCPGQLQPLWSTRDFDDMGHKFAILDYSLESIIRARNRQREQLQLDSLKVCYFLIIFILLTFYYMAFLTKFTLNGMVCYIGLVDGKFAYRDCNGKSFTRDNAHRFATFEEARRAALREDGRYTAEIPQIECTE